MKGFILAALFAVLLGCSSNSVQGEMWVECVHNVDRYGYPMTYVEWTQLDWEYRPDPGPHEYCNKIITRALGR